MIKGVFLGVCISVFVISFIVIIAYFAGGLAPNPITGAVVGQEQFAIYAVVSLVISFVIGMAVILKFPKIKFQLLNSN